MPIRLSSKTAEKILFWALVISFVAPFWAFRYIPTEDGPAHIGNAYIIKEYSDPAAIRIRDYYVINWRLPTNVLYHYALAALMFAVPPLIAEKLLLSLYVVIFALAVRYLIVAVYGRPHPAALLAFPLFISFPFQMGFFGSMWSVALAAFALAFFLRRRSTPTPLSIIALNGWGLVIFATHMLGWGVFVSGVLFASLAAVVGAAVAARKPAGFPRAEISRAWRWPLYIAPVAAAAPLFFFTRPKLSAVTRRPLLDLFDDFFTFEFLNSFFKAHNRITTVTAIAFGAIALALVVEKTFGPRPRRWRSRDVAAALAVPVALAVYFLSPDSTYFRGSWINVRLALLPALAAVLFFAGARSRWLSRALWVVAPAVALVNLGAMTAGYAEANRILPRFVAGEPLVGEDATFLTVVKSSPWRDNLKVSYVKHAGGYYTLGKRAVNLSNYEPNYPYFPVRWRRGKPARVVEIRDAVPYYNLRNKYEEIDYIIYWEAAPARENKPPAGAFKPAYKKKPLLILKRAG
jgi:MFS family permease